jgi:hypothetical protein
MKWDKEKEMLEQISDCQARVHWLASQLSKRGFCPCWQCDYEENCIKCWIAASGKAVKKSKKDAQA